jgi:transposase
VPDVFPVSSVEESLRVVNARLREVVAAKDVEIAELWALVTEAGLRIAGLERRLGMDSTDSGTPTSKESIGTRERRKARRRARDEDSSSRTRSPDRKPGAQSGHAGANLRREANPDDITPVDPPVECSSCGGELAEGGDVGTHWSQTWDIEIVRRKVEYRLPRRGPYRAGLARDPDATGRAGVSGIR